MSEWTDEDWMSGGCEAPDIRVLNKSLPRKFSSHHNYFTVFSISFPPLSSTRLVTKLLAFLHSAHHQVMCDRVSPPCIMITGDYNES